MGIQLLNILSQAGFFIVDISKTFEEQDLRMGSIVVVQHGPNMLSTLQMRPLALPPYGTHIPPPLRTISLGDELYQQAMEGRYTDVVFLSTQEDSKQSSYCLNAHKNVLATVSYFKTAFESGMKESNKGSESEPLTFETPPGATILTMKHFLSFLYLRDYPLLARCTIESLSRLLSVSDYYGFGQLTDAAVAAIEDKYGWLTPENVLQLLKTIDLLHFEKKTSLESLAVDYIANNFSKVARMQEFHDMYGTDVYSLIIDAVSNVSWKQ